MSKKKTKIFLGAYINNINAQNINCLALARYLNKNTFKVYSLSLYNENKCNVEAKVFKCFYPVRISKIIGFIWGILHCDVIYFPKHHSTPRWILMLSNILGKKLFTTIENNMCDLQKESMLNSFGGQKSLVNHFKYTPNIFGITQYIIDNANCGVQLEDKVLYLGVETDLFSKKVRERLRNIVFIGSLTKRKKLEEFLQLAQEFPHINFNIIGSGVDRISLKMQATENVTFFGQLNQQELAYKLNTMDLLFLPSRSEGFPKVILEAAACGIPSIVYSDYGAHEWMGNHQNGFVVNDFIEVVDIVKKLEDDNKLLSNISKGAHSMSLRFDWNLIVKDWEKVINNLK